MNKNLTTATKACNIVGGAILISSFFVSDNRKAVNMRIAAVGIFAAGWGIRIYNIVKS